MIINCTLTGLLCALSSSQVSNFLLVHTIPLPSAVPFSLLLQFNLHSQIPQPSISLVWIYVIIVIYTPRSALLILSIANYLLWYVFSFQLCYKLIESHSANKSILVVEFHYTECYARHGGYTGKQNNQKKFPLSQSIYSWGKQISNKEI